MEKIRYELIKSDLQLHNNSMHETVQFITSLNSTSGW